MRNSVVRQIGIAATAAIMAAGVSSSAQAQDFFQFLFGGIQQPRPAYAPRPQPMQRALPFADDGYASPAPAVSRPTHRNYSSVQAYCVRTCDGRYFPLSATGGESKAESCNSFCPASETKVVYGSTIDSARTSAGKPYADLPNAFKYRSEIVAGCTCNGKDQFGLAKISIDNDPTVRKGDIIAGKDGLMVADHSTAHRDSELALSPAQDKVRVGYEKVPVLAQD